MGKKQHQKDKLYLTHTEWRTEFGGYKEKQDLTKFRRLPFYCCSLSLQPFEHPYSTKEGIVFDLMNIVPFLKKYGRNPVNGEKASMKDMIKLNFQKNADGKYHCPVTFKVFNENSHIVAIKVTGNVYAQEAVQQLNIKASNMRDLITDEPFTRKDIITIQNPTELNKFNMSDFFHLKNNLKVIDEELEAAKKDPKFHLKCINSTTMEALKELDDVYKPKEEKLVEEKKNLDKFNAAHYSTGTVAASFTSTAMAPNTEHVPAIIDDEVLTYDRVKKKGYVRLVTNMGSLNLELHCEMVPKMCDNFIKLCTRGYYEDTIFHRSIRNFMIQGGDPEGTGKVWPLFALAFFRWMEFRSLGGFLEQNYKTHSIIERGESAWGPPFKDEFKPNLTHSGRGVLSMANSGPNTNKSQFFITFRSCRHLDGKHSVFGKVVGGLDTLEKMEKIETDSTNKPLEEIQLKKCIVFIDPFKEAAEQLKKDREEEEEKKRAEAEAKSAIRQKKVDQTLKVYKTGIGKYINPSLVKRPQEESTSAGSDSERKKLKGSYGFKDFSSW